MPNEEKKVNAIVDRGVDAVIAGDSKGKIFTAENASQMAGVSKEVLKGALTGAVKGALKGAVVGAFEGALEEANKAAALAAGKAPVSDVATEASTPDKDTNAKR